MNSREVDAVFFRGGAEHVMPRRAELADAEGPAGEITERFQPRVVGARGDEIADGMKAGALMSLRADDPQRTLAGEIVEAGAESGGTDIDIARHDGYGDRLG